MKAAVFRGVGAPLAIETVPDPVPGRGELIVRVAHCGVCGTDLHATDAEQSAVAAGMVLGHEFTGEVAACGPDTPGWRTGERVCALPFTSCRDCVPCRLGRPWQCAARRIIGLELPGGFAEFVRVDPGNVLRLPDSMGWREAALVEPLAVGVHAVRAAGGVQGRNVLVVGAGPIGLVTALWSRFFGARAVIVSEPDPARRALAQRTGATAVIDPNHADVPATFQQLAGDAPEIIFECVGLPGMIGLCAGLAPYGARLVVVGFCTRPDSFVPAVAMAKELNVQFVIAYTHADWRLAIDMLAGDRIAVAHLVTDVVGFAQFPDAFEALRRPTHQCKLLLNTQL